MAGQKLNEAVLSTMRVICSWLHKKKAPYLFHNKCNLFWKTSPGDLDCMFRKISKDIDRLENEGTSAYWNLLMKNLAMVDERYRVHKNSPGRAQTWKQNKKR